MVSAFSPCVWREKCWPSEMEATMGCVGTGVEVVEEEVEVEQGAKKKCRSALTTTLSSAAQYGFNWAHMDWSSTELFLNYLSYGLSSADMGSGTRGFPLPVYNFSDCWTIPPLFPPAWYSGIFVCVTCFALFVCGTFAFLVFDVLSMVWGLCWCIQEPNIFNCSFPALEISVFPEP